MARPKNPLLSRDLVADTALHIVDSEGSEGVSMRRIARELDVHPSSLYNHFNSRLDVIEEIRGAISTRINTRPLLDLEWEDGVIAWAKSYRSAFALHPRIIPLLMSTRASSAVTLAMYEHFTSAALRAGWAAEEVVPLLTAIESFILGSVLDMSGPNSLFDTSGQEDDFPKFSGALATLQSSMPDDTVADRAFELGLKALVHGMHPLAAPTAGGD